MRIQPFVSLVLSLSSCTQAALRMPDQYGDCLVDATAHCRVSPVSAAGAPPPVTDASHLDVDAADAGDAADGSDGLDGADGGLDASEESSDAPNDVRVEAR